MTRPLTEEEKDSKAEWAYREYEEAGYELASDLKSLAGRRAELAKLRADPEKAKADRLIAKEADMVTWLEGEVSRRTQLRNELEAAHGERWTRLALKWPLPVRGRHEVLIDTSRPTPSPSSGPPARQGQPPAPTSGQPDPPPTWPQVLEAAGVIADKMAADEPAATDRRLKAAPNSTMLQQFEIVRGLLDNPNGGAWTNPEMVAIPKTLGLSEYITARRVAIGRASGFGPALEARFRARATVRTPALKRESLDVYTGWHLAGQLGWVTDRHVARVLVDHYAGRKPFVLDDYMATFTAFTRDDPPELKPVVVTLADDAEPIRPAAPPAAQKPAPKQPQDDPPAAPPRNAAPPKQPKVEPKPPPAEQPVPANAITLPKRAFYLLGESPSDLDDYQKAGIGSTERTELEQRGKVTRYTEPPLVVIVKRGRDTSVVDVWSGSLKGKQRYISSDYLAAKP